MWTFVTKTHGGQRLVWLYLAVWIDAESPSNRPMNRDAAAAAAAADTRKPSRFRRCCLRNRGCSAVGLACVWSPAAVRRGCAGKVTWAQGVVAWRPTRRASSLWRRRRKIPRNRTRKTADTTRVFWRPDCFGGFARSARPDCWATGTPSKGTTSYCPATTAGRSGLRKDWRNLRHHVPIKQCIQIPSLSLSLKNNFFSSPKTFWNSEIQFQISIPSPSLTEKFL